MSFYKQILFHIETGEWFEHHSDDMAPGDSYSFYQNPGDKFRRNLHVFMLESNDSAIEVGLVVEGINTDRHPMYDIIKAIHNEGFLFGVGK